MDGNKICTTQIIVEFVLRRFHELSPIKNRVKTIVGHAAFDAQEWCNLFKGESIILWQIQFVAYKPMQEDLKSRSEA